MEISIHTAKKEDLLAIIELANIQLGKDYLTYILLNALDNNDYLLKTAKIANSKIVGFCLSIQKGKKVLLKSIAVNPNYTKKGIATLLVSNCIDFATSNNYTIIKSIAWQSKYGIQLKGVFNYLNFIKKEDLPYYWKQESLEKGYNCPDCGAPPCLCTAIVFEKQL